MRRKLKVLEGFCSATLDNRLSIDGHNFGCVTQSLCLLHFQTLNTAVVQIYKTEGSAHAHWKKRYTGVVCFVKDSAIRSYFMRAYCLIKNELIWEHEIYDGMQVVKSRPFLLTFEGSVSISFNPVSSKVSYIF